MQAGEIFVDIKLRKDKFDKGLSDSKQSLKLFALEALGSVYLLDRFVEKSTNSAASLVNLSKASGVTASSLKKIGNAASFFNSEISSEDASKKLAAFAKNLYLIPYGQGNVAGFNKLQAMGRGISYVGKTTSEVFDSLREAGKGLTNQQFSDVLSDLGLEGFLPLMKASNEEIEAFYKNLNRTDEEIEKLNKADKIINSIKENWAYLQESLVLRLSPALEGLAQSLADAGATISGKSASNPQYKSKTDWLNKRGFGGVLWDSFAKGFTDAAKITAHSLTWAGYTAYGGAKGILGGEGAGEAEIREAARLLNLDPTETSTSSGTAKPRLNNFGNLRGASGEFRSFSTPEEGMKALVDDISAKIRGRSRAMAGKYGAGYIPTISKLISTFAPPNENNTQNYIDFVSKQTGIDANRPLTMSDVEGIVKSIIKMEGNKNISINNTNHIHGGNAEDIANMMRDQFKQQLKHANADLGNGAH